MKPIIPPAMPPNIITKIISPTLMPDVYETSIICISLLILNHYIIQETSNKSSVSDKAEVEEQFASDSERNSKPRGNGAAALRQAVE